MFNPPAWMRRGYCVGADPDIFQSDDAIEIAKAYCQRCPVRFECLNWAMRHDEVGVWGGTTDGERHRTRRGGKRASCPQCRAKQLRTINKQTICTMCGASWTF